MKRIIITAFTLSAIVACVVGAYFTGVRVGKRNADIDHLASQACYTACQLAWLRERGYAESNHLARMETHLDVVVAQLSWGRSYASMPETQRKQISIVKGYRARHPFTLPVVLDCDAAAYTLDYREIRHNEAELFMAAAPAEKVPAFRGKKTDENPTIGSSVPSTRCRVR